LYGVGRYVERYRTNAHAVFAAMIITVADDLFIEGEEASVVVLSRSPSNSSSGRPPSRPTSTASSRSSGYARSQAVVFAYESGLVEPGEQDVGY
jgi:hypothetical protein